MFQFGHCLALPHFAVCQNTKRTMFYVWVNDGDGGVASAWVNDPRSFAMLESLYGRDDQSGFAKLCRALLERFPWRPLPKGADYNDQWVAA